MDTQLAGIGDNSGGMDQAFAIRENLKEQHGKVVDRAAELQGALARVPEVASDRETADKMSEFVRQCTAFVKNAKDTRVEAKEPYLSGGRAVDGFFNNLIDAVEKVKTTALQRRTAYDMKVEAEERAAREAAAKRAAEEAQRLAAEAKTVEQQAAAAHAGQVAQEKQEAAVERPAELTRTRSDTGVTTSLRREWRHRIVDAKKVPKKFMVPDDGLIRAALKAATKPDGTVDFDYPGIEIYQHSFSQVR